MASADTPLPSTLGLDLSGRLDGACVKRLLVNKTHQPEIITDQKGREELISKKIIISFCRCLPFLQDLNIEPAFVRY